MSDEAQGGRIFFSSTGRSLVDEDEIVVLSVGVDIGSSTSHLVFSRIVLERLDSRYVVTKRETFHQSDILLTPYSTGETIDADALGAFIEQQYKDAKIDPDEIDTGALILTGVAVRRSNARAIGELFARQAGKMVAVSAGDNLETVMAAYGSGAVARSIRDNVTVMNVDIGGGTSKIAVCADGKVIDLTAVDVGARLVCLDDAGRIVRIEEAGRRFAAELGIKLEIGAHAVAGVGAGARGPHGGPAVRGDEGRRADDRRLGAVPARSAQPGRTIDRGHVLRRRVRIHLRPRGAVLRRSRRAAGAGDPRARRRLGTDARALERGHPRHRDRRLAIHHAGERQHDLRLADGDAAAAQRAGDRADACRSTARSSTARRCRAAIKGVLRRLDLGEGDTPGRRVRALARLGDVPAARRLLQGRGRRARPTCWRRAIRSCSPATATSAACSASTCARR